MEDLPGNPDAVGTMFRRCLKSPSWRGFRNLGGKDLYERIKNAAGEGHLTRDLAN